jgi:hypothetical protein
MPKVKGASILDSVKYLRRHKDAARKHLPPALHHYLSERVLAATWYPGEDLIPLVRAIARIENIPDAVYFERAGRFGALGHAHGIYKHLAEGDRESLTRRALVLWSSLHDTGTMEMQVESPGKVRVALRNFGLPSREFCLLTGGYIAATFESAGCKGVRHEKQSCAIDGAPACTWLVSWTNKIRM